MIDGDRGGCGAPDSTAPQ